MSVKRGTGHVGDGGVAAAVRVLGVAERVVLGGGLREPDVSTVAAELAGLEGFGDVFFDDDGAAGGVDEPGTCEVWLAFKSLGTRKIAEVYLASSC